MAELLQNCNGLTAHGDDFYRATHGCCLAEMRLHCNEFDLDSLKLVSKPEDLTDAGFAKGPTAVIAAAVH